MNHRWKQQIQQKQNKDQQEKQTKKRNTKHENKIIQRWRTGEPNSQKWKQVGFEKGMSGKLFEGKKHKWRKERANKDRAKETKRECYLKGLMKDKIRNTESWKGRHKKKKENNNKKKRRVLKEGLWGEEKSKEISPTAGHSFVCHRQQHLF